MRNLLIIGFALLCVIAVWLARYEVVAAHSANGPGDVYILDRWTGRVDFMRSGEGQEVTVERATVPKR